MTTQGRGPGAEETNSPFRDWIWGFWTLMTCMIQHRPVSLVMWGKIQALGPTVLLSGSAAPLSAVMCNLSTFRIHLTFHLTRHRLKDRFVCTGHSRYLADTHNVSIEQCWGPCSTSPVSHLLEALHHNLETPSTRQGRYTDRNRWPGCFLYEVSFSWVMKYIQNWKKKKKKGVINLIGMTGLKNECCLALIASIEVFAAHWVKHPIISWVHSFCATCLK